MKTIKLYNYEIENIIKVLSHPQSILYTDDQGKKLPLSVLWKIDENVETLHKIRERIQKKRNEIEQEYSDDEHSYDTTNENGYPVRKVKDEYEKEFNQKINELMSISNDVVINEIDISLLEDYSFVPRDYRSIRFMLDKKETEEVDEVEEKEEATEN